MPASSAGSRVAIIESARGFAASYVFISHITLISGIHLLFRGGNYLFQPFSYGHQAVLLFFFLSGFSIHYASRQRPLNTWQGRLEYAYLRFRRLYPLYLIAIVATIVLVEIGNRMWLVGTDSAGNVLDWNRVLATVFFVADYPWPGHWFEVIPTNTPLWSLAYEVVYYALYPMFWFAFTKFGILRTFTGAVLISVVFAALNFVWKPNHISNVLSLYWLWAAGALLAEWRISQRQILMSAARFYLVWLGTVMATFLFERQPLPFFTDWLWGGIIFVTMSSFLVTFPADITGADRQGIGWIAGLLFVGIVIAWFIPFAGSRTFLCGRILISAAFAVWWAAKPQTHGLSKACSIVLRPFFEAGAYSYGLYVIHMPIICFLMHCFKYWLVPLPPVWLWLSPLVVLPIARVLELHWQPKIAAQMDCFRSVCSTAKGITVT